MRKQKKATWGLLVADIHPTTATTFNGQPPPRMKSHEKMNKLFGCQLDILVYSTMKTLGIKTKSRIKPCTKFAISKWKRKQVLIESLLVVGFVFACLFWFDLSHKVSNCIQK